MDEFEIKTILVPTDFSKCADRAMEYALGLAEKVKARVVLMHVVEITPFSTAEDILAVGMVTERMLAAAKDNLKGLAERIKNGAQLKATCVTYIGNVYSNIIRAVHAYKVDMVVMGTEGNAGLANWLFGNIAGSVVANTAIPVLTVNSDSEVKPIKRIAFPISENLLTIKKAKQVLSLAEVLRSTILFMGYAPQKRSNVIELLHGNYEEMSKRFAKRGVECAFELSGSGDYPEEVLNFATANYADLIAVTSDKKHHTKRFFSDRIDKAVVSHSIIPVLSVPVV